MRTLRTVVTLSGCLVLSSAVAQVLPLEIRQEVSHYNFQSTNGVPLSSVRGNPPGSDGRVPVGLDGTSNQFQGFLAFGGGIATGSNSSQLNTNISVVANALNLDLPRSQSGNYVMPFARIGAPFVRQNNSYYFGAVVPVPATDEFGVPLAVDPATYWVQEPYTSTGHSNVLYYWSANSEKVYAVNPGPLEIVWRRASQSGPTNAPNISTVNIGNNNYRIYTNRYFVSGSPVQLPRIMYWTEGAFRPTGKPIAVPSARVGGVKIIYNTLFPERVADNEVYVGSPGIEPNATNRLDETRTLWYDSDRGQILAYNRQGRVFMEMLGDLREDGVTRQSLGIELVDVIQQPTPLDVTIELGELLHAFADNNPDDSDLFPEPIQQVGQNFTFQHNIPGTEQIEYFATRETVNQNDVLVHWLQESRQGLKWPLVFSRYKLVWPDDVTKYSHYVRPLATNEAEAKLTSVPLPTENAPIINYQDPLDQPRGKLTERFEYYTFLTAQYPAHRGLIRFASDGYVSFERVFSWLDQNLKTPTNFVGSVATNLISWNPTNRTFNWPTGIAAPRVVNVTVNVGDRISAPSGETGAAPGTNYLAGYILEFAGTSYNPNAYANPFDVGFEAANRGAIIPVNAIPGANNLEVWWFRQNQVTVSRGFKNTMWPAVIGRYTLQWPGSAPEIVLAGNDGSGPLLSLEAKGGVYFQNDKSLPGYNPNEEHAFMQGGQVYALRDDLSITNAGPTYSSHPFVLLEYQELDGRPALRLFKVLREKPDVTFDYAVSAATILQAPMPLPLLEKPFAPLLLGQQRKSLNTEINTWTANSSVAASAGGITSWSFAPSTSHAFARFRPIALQPFTTPTQPPQWLFPTNVSVTNVSGLISARKPGVLAVYGGAQSGNPQRWRYASSALDQLTSNATVVVFNVASNESWMATVVATNPALQ